MSRILQLSKYYFPSCGGIELVAKNISKAHRLISDHVDIICFGESNFENIGPYGEKVYTFKEDFKIFSAPFSLSNFKLIIKMISEGYDKIYVHLPNPFMHEMVRWFNTKKNLIVGVYHSDIVNKGLLGNLYQSYFHYTDNIYAFQIASSQALVDSSIYLSTLAQSKLKIVHFCVDETSTEFKRTSFNGKILAIGRLVPYKGFDFLIEALANSPYELHIIGEGPEEVKLKKIKQNLKAENVFFHQAISDEEKNIYLNQAGVLINSSINRSEAYGMCIVEAFENGLPVLASDLDSGVTFLVQNGVTGVTFKIKDKEDLLLALKKLENDDGFYQSLAINARKFYEDNLSFEQFKGKILTI